jgi:hypothetical protein
LLFFFNFLEIFCKKEVQGEFEKTINLKANKKKLSFLFDLDFILEEK